MYSINIEIPASPPAETPVGLLVAIPPDSMHQRLESYVVRDAPEITPIQALESRQHAFFLPDLQGIGQRFEFQLSTVRSEAPPQHHFQQMLNRYTKPSAELVEAIAELTKTASDNHDAVARIIEFTASLFDYDHPQARFYDGKDEIPLLDKLTKGSCQDINTFLLSSLYAANIASTYYAGYFFPAGQSPSVKWFHCWVSTLIHDEQQDWDIAHHIMAGVRDIRPSLNPKPGNRAAMSYGRGLRFNLSDDVQVLLPHLGQPLWVFTDGRTQPAGATATLDVRE